MSEVFEIDCSEGVPLVEVRRCWRDEDRSRILEAFGGPMAPDPAHPFGRDPAFAPSARSRRSIESAARRQAASGRTSFMIRSVVLVLAGVIVMGLASWALLRRLSLLVLLAALALSSGCVSSAVLEADVYKALVVADEGVTWAAGHEAEITAAIKNAAALDPSNKTLQSAAAKATTAINNGDLGAAQAFVRSTRIVFSPAPVPVATPPAGQ